jgi:hypothetical protein
MPKVSHESLVQLVRNAPAMIPDLLWPERQDRTTTPIQVTAAELVDLNLAEYRADVVLALGVDPQHPRELVIVEAQTEVSPRKRRSWPQYITGLHARFAYDVALVVVALDPAVARWAAEPIDLGRACCVVTPLVLGRALIPAITDIEQARQTPELAVLSVAAHAGEPDIEPIVRAAWAATAGLDMDRDRLYPDFIIALLGRAARAILEKIMPTSGNPYQSEIFRELWDKGHADGEAEGEARGRAAMLLKMLALKSFTPTDAQRERILSCTDTAVLDRWADRLLVARTLEEVFAD